MNRAIPGLVTLALTATSVSGQDVWSIEELGPGVYVSVVSDPAVYSQYANSLIVVGDESVLVVDTRESERLGRVLVEEVRSLTDKPISHVVNTHWHWDHLGGNQAFLDAFPGTEVLGHAETSRLLEEEGRSRFQAQIDQLATRRERLEGIRERGATDSGRQLGPDDYAEIERILTLDATRSEALTRTRLVGPTTLVGSGREIDLGGRTVRVIAPVPAHTPGDLVVWVPDLGLLYMGDLIEHGAPWLGDGDAYAMAPSLHELDGLGASIHMPSHGPVPDDDALFRGQHAFWSQVHELASDADSDEDHGELVDRLVADADPEGFPGYFSEDGEPSDAFRRFAEESLAQAIRDR